MGARPVANLNCLRFGARSHHKTPDLVAGVVKGIGDYGNCVGIPTVGGSVSFDENYNGNCLVNAMTVGLIHRNKIFKGYATGIGNLVVYVGSATGRDGIHGATMASDSFEETAGASKTTIQVGDPFAEKLLMEATLEVLEKGLVVGIQDMGAAGLTSSSFEMADRAGNGVYISLDNVPTRAQNMTAYEIMLSESQERMLMVIEPNKWAELQAVLKKWQLSHAVIGEVTDTGRMQIEAKGVLEIDLPVAPLTDEAPVYERPISSRRSACDDSSALQELRKRLSGDLGYALDLYRKMIADVGSKKQIIQQFDRHVGGKTVFDSERGGAAVMWIRSRETGHKPFLGLAMTAGCNERRVKNSPLIGASEAVRDCARTIVAAGGQPIAVTDCLNFGNAEDADVMRDFSDSVDGITEACQALGTPVVSGNVSLYNATGTTSIFPTPMIGMVGKLDDVRKAVPATVESSQDLLICTITACSVVKTSLAASLAAKNANIPPTEGAISAIDWTAEKQSHEAIHSLQNSGYLVAARAAGEGGIGLAAFKMAINSVRLGASLEILTSDGMEFFGEGAATFLVAIKPENLRTAMNLAQQSQVSLEVAATISISDHLETIRRKGEIKTYFGSISAEDLLASFEAFLPTGTT
jgi:phosphoribosylformylglycinamidine synthase